MWYSACSTGTGGLVLELPVLPCVGIEQEVRWQEVATIFVIAA
jgi:hypothetical protein